jgi:hypothetical protein
MGTWLKENQDTTDKLNALTETFQGMMEQIVVSIGHINYEQVYNQAYLIAENEQLSFKTPGLKSNDSGYNFLKKLYAALNNQDETSIIQTAKHIDSYKENYPLRELDHAVAQKTEKKYFKTLLMIFSFIIGLPGILVYKPALILSKKFCDSKIKHRTFYAPVRIVVSMVSHLITSLIIFILLTLIFNIIYSLLIIVSLQLSLFAFAFYKDFMPYVRLAFNGEVQSNMDSLKNKRNILVNEIYGNDPK